MALKDIIGQELALGILRGCITKNRLAHAYLFTGEDGIGKKLAAINFAKALNCLKTVTSYESRVMSEFNPPTPSFTPLEKATDFNRWLLPIEGDSGLKPPSPQTVRGQSSLTGFTKGGQRGFDSEVQTPNSKLQTQIDSCDECSSCIKINKSIHPDVFLIAPAGGQIKVDVIRKLGESLSYKVFEGRWKIAIIDGAETFNQSAANAFLKTLEEPPGQSLLILISSIPELIPETIQSRCQKIRFSPLPLKKMNEFLEQNSKLKTQNPKLLSALSGGRPGWALSEDLIERRDKAFDGFKTLLSRAEEDLWDGRDSMEEWFEWVHLWLRDIAVFNVTKRTELLINQDRKEEIQDISKKAELKDILKLSSILYNIKKLLRFNLNKQVVLYHTHLLLKKTFGRISA